MVGDFKQASLVLFGKLTNARFGPSDAAEGGSTDLKIEMVLKGKDVIGSKRLITLPRYIPVRKSKYLLFCDVYKGRLDPYRPVEVQGGGDIIKYLKGAVALRDAPISRRLRYCFDYLEDPEPAISLDAYREFAAADYKAYRYFAKKLPPDRIAGWLQDTKTTPYRYGLYASLLGHCGKEEHARTLRRLLDTPGRRMGSGVDGMLVAYTLLKPREGWAYLRDQVLTKPKEEFQLRYAGLRAVRFLWEYRPDVVRRKDLVNAVCLLLHQTDVADFAIEDLRRWKAWEAAERVLALGKTESHNLPVIRRALLRFALSCPPRHRQATEFIKAERRKDKEYVADVEELLRLEMQKPPTVTPTAKKK